MRNLKIAITSCCLSVLLCLSFLLPGLINTKQQLAVRNVDANELGTISYEEKIEQMLEPFDYYGGNVDGNVIEFEASLNFLNDLNSVQFLSTVDDGEQITKKYKTKLDVENEKFFIITQFICNDEVIEEDYIEAEPYYDEITDDYFIKMPNGEIVSIKESIQNDNFNECMAATMAVAATTALIAAELLLMTIVVNEPTITKVVTTVITTVVTVVKSIISWFRSLFTKKTTTVITQTTTTVLTPSISIAGVKYETKAMTKDETLTLNSTVYYLCFADPTNAKMYISAVPIDYTVALTIMSCPTLVPCIGNNKKQMIASVYSLSQAMAYEIASAAILSSPIPENHGENKGYYWHYHSEHSILTNEGKYARPHSFFSTFCLTY